MKKSKIVQLVLITSLLASCHKHTKKKDKEWEGNSTYMRADSSAGYSRVHTSGDGWLLWYLAFRPYGSFYGGQYHHAGYYSSAIPQVSNIGHNSVKSGIVRGGFGSSGRSFSVSS